MTVDPSLAVVKIGGSLLDLPDLPDRFYHWRNDLQFAKVILVVGGGSTANFVRDMDAKFGLGEEKSHWLAIRAMTFNAHCFAACLTNEPPVTANPDCAARLSILDAYAFLHADNSDENTLPCHWNVTSDSIAARVAEKHNAAALYLLKSCSRSKSETFNDLAKNGKVDPYFPTLAERLRQTCKIEWVNFRQWQVKPTV